MYLIGNLPPPPPPPLPLSCPQGVFAIQGGVKQSLKERRVFLFNHALLITKRRREAEKESYAIKEQLLVGSGAPLIQAHSKCPV